MKTFIEWSDVPREFEGHCYIGVRKAQYWVGKNRHYHREDGPAVIHDDGTKYWYQNDKQHRLDGPAVVYEDGMVCYFIDNIKFAEQEYWCHPLVTKNKFNKLLEL